MNLDDILMYIIHHWLYNHIIYSSFKWSWKLVDINMSQFWHPNRIFGQRATTKMTNFRHLQIWSFKWPIQRITRYKVYKGHILMVDDISLKYLSKYPRQHYQKWGLKFTNFCWFLVSFLVSFLRSIFKDPEIYFVVGTSVLRPWLVLITTINQ